MSHLGKGYQSGFILVCTVLNLKKSFRSNFETTNHAKMFFFFQEDYFLLFSSAGMLFDYSQKVLVLWTLSLWRYYSLRNATFLMVDSFSLSVSRVLCFFTNRKKTQFSSASPHTYVPFNLVIRTSNYTYQSFW